MSNITISTKTVMPFIEPRKEEMVKLMGGEDVLLREMSFAIQAANNNYVLATATPQSVAMAVYNCALTKLSLNPVMNLAYLVPFKGNAKLMPGYQGLIKLISDSGIIRSVSSAVVYRGDDFELIQGTNPSIMHKPKGETFLVQDIIAVYAVFILHNGESLFEVMWKPQIDGIMNRSETGKQGKGPWSTDYAEMARKTVVKRGWKSIPKSSVALESIEKVNKAIDIDNEEYKIAEYVKMSEEQVEKLLNKTTNVDELELALSDESVMIDPEQKVEIIEKAKAKKKGGSNE
jgi:phage RecT family recombinase